MSALEFSQLLGNYGEFVGAIAVVGTLIYLGSQIRQNTKQMRAMMAAEMTTQWLSNAHAMALDPHIADAPFDDNLDGENPSSPIDAQMSFRISAFFKTMEFAYYQMQQGNLDRMLWETNAAGLGDSINSLSGSTFWRYRKHWYTKEFQAYVDQFIEDQRST